MINQILFFSKAANEQPIKCLSNSQITKEYSWSDNYQLFNSTGMAKSQWKPAWLEGREVCDHHILPKAPFFPTLDHHHHPVLTACSQAFVPTGVEGQGVLIVPQSQGTGDGVPRGQGMGCPGTPQHTHIQLEELGTQGLPCCLSRDSVHILCRLQTNPQMLSFDHVNQGKIKIHKHNLAQLSEKQGMTF